MAKATSARWRAAEVLARPKPATTATGSSRPPSARQASAAPGFAEQTAEFTGGSEMAPESIQELLEGLMIGSKCGSRALGLLPKLSWSAHDLAPLPRRLG